MPRKAAGYIATLSVLVSFVAALTTFFLLLGDPPEERSHSSTLWTWLTAGEFRVGLEILVDPLSVFMMLVVSGVGFLIVGYAIGYMDGSDEERRFFAYMALFVFSMLLLVQAGDLLILLAGWGLVGLCSYLLIGYDHHRPSAIAAAKKAFIMNAFGDATMVLALILLVQRLGTLEYGSVFERVDEVGGDWAMTLVALGLLGGAVAKSAQVPLHTWLPDAMEGPTPVSALIHAATMVTAGVYMLVRLNPIFEEAEAVQDLAAGLGAVTLLMAGLIALVQTDIKRVIAYSTMSQIGDMFLAAGVTSYGNAMFHLMTHAFFKALLVLAAGIGAVTLLMAGLIALVQTDIKRVIAYSTMSQIGYMFLGAGLGAYANAMFL
ncbi:MAG TPA: NADH-quinone oxidoreductase subunit L, partial [Gaiellaceae bacterium]|nr:NADH-quinone oxidoreductase subunit L [Gaiellaceae bacterium]